MNRPVLRVLYKWVTQIMDYWARNVKYAKGFGGIVSNVRVGSSDRYRETRNGKGANEREAKGRGNLKLPEASGTLVTSTENGPITDDAFDRGRVFNYAPQERGTASPRITVNGSTSNGKIAVQLPYAVCTHV